MNKKVIIHSKKRVFDGFFKLEEAQVSFEKFNGEMSPVVSRLNFERGDSAAAIIFNIDTQEIILVNQFKYPTYAKGPGWITETVAGIVDKNESPEDAIKREVKEETGYAVSVLERIASFYVSPGGTSERIILFYAEVKESGKRQQGGGVKSEGEDIIPIRLSIAEAQKLIDGGHLVDAKTIIAVMWLLQRFSTK